jgi:hypothetical protein
MVTDKRDASQRPEASSELERELIEAYVAGARREAGALVGHNDAEVRRILDDASAYASSRLRDIEDRREYFRTLSSAT